MEEMPSDREKRLVLRLLAHWRELCGDRAFPSFAEVDPTAIPDIWPSCFVLDVARHRDDPVFCVVGDVYAGIAETDLCNCRISDLPEDTLARKSTSFCQEVIAKEIPISRGGEFINGNGTSVLYRSIMLPLGDDGETVSSLLGAANCHVISSE